MGLIPACAGKTVGFPRDGGPFAAHPRVCGENIFTQFRAGCLLGSSPRVRGKLRATQEGGTLFGLIPACAGKTLNLGKPHGYQPAHPRVCGENSINERTVADSNGSSPRVRGKRRPDEHALRDPRLIPACAGKTFCEIERVCICRAHPRVCGENRFDQVGYYADGGSSPRVRGKPGAG